MPAPLQGLPTRLQGLCQGLPLTSPGRGALPPTRLEGLQKLLEQTRRLLLTPPNRTEVWRQRPSTPLTACV